MTTHPDTVVENNISQRLWSTCWGNGPAANEAVEEAVREIARYQVALDEARARAEAAERRVERLILGLEQLKRMLTVPAAEYVPVIPECWAVINELIDTSGSADRGGEG